MSSVHRNYTPAADLAMLASFIAHLPVEAGFVITQSMTPLGAPQMLPHVLVVMPGGKGECGSGENIYDNFLRAYAACLHEVAAGVDSVIVMRADGTA